MHARVLTYKNKGKDHQMHQKMINASWDGHSLARSEPPLQSKMASPEASPAFLAKMRLSIEFASHITSQRGGSRRGDRGVSVELVPRGGGKG